MNRYFGALAVLLFTLIAGGAAAGEKDAQQEVQEFLDNYTKKYISKKLPFISIKIILVSPNQEEDKTKGKRKYIQ